MSQLFTKTYDICKNFNLEQTIVLKNKENKSQIRIRLLV